MNSTMIAEAPEPLEALKFASQYGADRVQARGPVQLVSRACSAATALAAMSLPTAANAVECVTDSVIILPTSQFSDIETASVFATKIRSTTENLVDQVRKLSSLENGWHSSESKAASASSLKDAESFIRSVKWENATLPSISLAEDGEVNFAWLEENLYLDLGFFGDGTYSFYAERANGERFTGDDIAVLDYSGISLISSLISKF